MGDLGFLELAVLSAPVWAILCALVASSKGRSVGGWAFAGLIFGVFAFLFVLVAGKSQGEAYRPRYSKATTDPFATTKKHD